MAWKIEYKLNTNYFTLYDQKLRFVKKSNTRKESLFPRLVIPDPI